MTRQAFISVTIKALIVLSFIALLLWFLAESVEEDGEAEPEQARLPVTVVTAVPGAAQIEVTASGLTMPRWLTDINSSVDARVKRLAANAEPGQLLKKGETLLSFHATYYHSELAAAKARVAEAELNLAQYKNEQYVAKKLGKGKKLSEFGRFEPHVKAAEAALNAAKAALVVARQQVADTEIKAPFPALMIATSAVPGQWRNNGDALFQIAASEWIDIQVLLPASRWQRLGVLRKGQEIQVTAPSGKTWRATVRYLSPVLDATTRQRSVMLEVANPYLGEQPLLADQQVTVQFIGPSLANVVRAPASVLTEDGKVWSVIDGKLQLEAVEVLEEQQETVLYRYLEQPAQTRQLVRFPLSTMLQGQTVDVQQGDAA